MGDTNVSCKIPCIGQPIPYIMPEIIDLILSYFPARCFWFGAALVNTEWREVFLANAKKEASEIGDYLKRCDKHTSCFECEWQGEDYGIYVKTKDNPSGYRIVNCENMCFYGSQYIIERTLRYPDQIFFRYFRPQEIRSYMQSVALNAPLSNHYNHLNNYETLKLEIYCENLIQRYAMVSFDFEIMLEETDIFRNKVSNEIVKQILKAIIDYIDSDEDLKDKCMMWYVAIGKA